MPMPILIIGHKEKGITRLTVLRLLSLPEKCKKMICGLPQLLM